MTRLLLDTSVLIEILRKNLFLEGSISVITLIEFLRGMPIDKVEQAKRLLEETYTVLGIDNKVILEYLGLYKQLKEKGKLLPDADLLIASTAKAHDLVLITKDKDFTRLRELGVKTKLWETAGEDASDRGKS